MSNRKRGAFTLIELLVVIAVIALLIAILLPTLLRAELLAREAVCVSHLHSVGQAVATYQASRDVLEPWIFSNGSGDHPHEGKKAGKQTGNPARVLVPEFVHPKMFFCPIGPITYEKHYDQTPQNTGGVQTYWGTYCWRYRKIRRHEDPDFPRHHGNDIRYVNDYTGGCVMTDSDAHFWAQQGFNYRWFHFNVLMRDGSAKLITRDDTEARYWLWGPKLKPYDSYGH